jgi:7-cyano-7-deazaguanine synthase
MKAVAIVSGGLDSVTLAYDLHTKLTDELSILSFNYGQRHAKELEFVKECANRLHVRWHLVDLSSVQKLLGSSALTDSSVSVPEGHYEDESMKITVVPNRNAIMLSIAFGHAIAIGASVVAFGAHAGDHFIYPDCRPAFVDSFQQMEWAVTEGKGPILSTPFIQKKKSDIVKLGVKLGVPFDRTWSCYKGEELHCGLCGTCCERKESFKLSGVNDPTMYRI